MMREMHEWTSMEIAQWAARRRQDGLPNTITPAQPPRLLALPRDAGGIAMRQHRRDSGALKPQPSLAPLTDAEADALRKLHDLDSRTTPAGQTVYLCQTRRRLGASADTMARLYRRGLVTGAGSVDAWGTGNTPDSEYYWLTTAGMALFH